MRLRWPLRQSPALAVWLPPAPFRETRFVLLAGTPSPADLPPLVARVEFLLYFDLAPPAPAGRGGFGGFSWHILRIFPRNFI